MRGLAVFRPDSCGLDPMQVRGVQTRFAAPNIDAGGPGKIDRAATRRIKRGKAGHLVMGDQNRRRVLGTKQAFDAFGIALGYG